MLITNIGFPDLKNFLFFYLTNGIDKFSVITDCCDNTSSNRSGCPNTNSILLRCFMSFFSVSLPLDMKNKRNAHMK